MHEDKEWCSSHLGQHWQQAVAEAHSEELPEVRVLVVHPSTQEVPMLEPGSKLFNFDINFRK